MSTQSSFSSNGGADARQQAKENAHDMKIEAKKLARKARVACKAAYIADQKAKEAKIDAKVTEKMYKTFKP